jgi:hypothetical protein
MADPMDKAEKAFKKEEQRREGKKNLADYEQAAIVEQKKTERLQPPPRPNPRRKRRPQRRPRRSPPP